MDSVASALRSDASGRYVVKVATFSKTLRRMMSSSRAWKVH